METLREHEVFLEEHPDPRVRKDGLCVVCGKERKMAKNRLKGVDPSIYAKDPFCSSPCCKQWHGVAERGTVA